MCSVNVSGQTVKQDIEEPDYKLVANHIADKSYLTVCDFDDHFENCDNDWRNT